VEAARESSQSPRTINYEKQETKRGTHLGVEQPAPSTLAAGLSRSAAPARIQDVHQRQVLPSVHAARNPCCSTGSSSSFNTSAVSRRTSGWGLR